MIKTAYQMGLVAAREDGEKEAYAQGVKAAFDRSMSEGRAAKLRRHTGLGIGGAMIGGKAAPRLPGASPKAQMAALFASILAGGATGVGSSMAMD